MDNNITVVLVIALLLIVALERFLSNKIKKTAKDKELGEKYSICFKKVYDKTNLPLAQLKVNGKLEWFLIDTGATLNLIREDYLTGCGKKIEFVDSTDSIFTGSDKIISKTCVLDVHHKDINFKAEKFSIAQLNAFVVNETIWGFNVVGIIGGQLLREYKWTVDYDKMIMTLNK